MPTGEELKNPIPFDPELYSTESMNYFMWHMLIQFSFTPMEYNILYIGFISRQEAVRAMKAFLKRGSGGL